MPSGKPKTSLFHASLALTSLALLLCSAQLSHVSNSDIAATKESVLTDYYGINIEQAWHSTYPAVHNIIKHSSTQQVHGYAWIRPVHGNVPTVHCWHCSRSSVVVIVLPWSLSPGVSVRACVTSVFFPRATTLLYLQLCSSVQVLRFFHSHNPALVVFVRARVEVFLSTATTLR